MSPPHATHVVPPEQTVKGALQPTFDPQQACPSPPHAVPQPLVVIEHAWALAQLLPVATHVWFDWSQHPLPHVLPSQQGWPLPPHVAHLVPVEHARGAPAFWPVQNAPFLPLPGQQAAPEVPQFVPPERQWPALQLPTSPPHETVLPVAMHPPAVQHEVPVVHRPSPQHGCPLPPQVTELPDEQTFPAVVVCPLATQVVPVQHPPPRHELPEQHSCVGSPQPTQLPPEHTSFVPEHAAPLLTHLPLPGSQHPPLPQVLPAQHALPLVPHVVHVPP